MISPTAIALAITLPPLLFLLILLTFILIRTRMSRDQTRNSLEIYRSKYADIEKKLATFPKVWDEMSQDSGFSMLEIEESGGTYYTTLQNFLLKWLDEDNPRKDSATRIEAILFPELPPKHHLHGSKDINDMKVFPNPHQYTPAEICSFLEMRDSISGNRLAISEYIANSIILHAISLDCNPFQALLPFSPPDIYGLEKLKTMVLGVELSWNIDVHISKFGFYYAHKEDTKSEFVKLFESLFDPYFSKRSPEDATQRQRELLDLLDAAINYGMKMIGQQSDKFEHRWGTKDDSVIVCSPSFHNLTYRDKKLKYDTELWKSTGLKMY